MIKHGDVMASAPRCALSVRAIHNCYSTGWQFCELLLEALFTVSYLIAKQKVWRACPALLCYQALHAGCS
jgi:hypothetical protein